MSDDLTTSSLLHIALTKRCSEQCTQRSTIRWNNLLVLQELPPVRCCLAEGEEERLAIIVQAGGLPRRRACKALLHSFVCLGECITCLLLCLPPVTTTQLQQHRSSPFLGSLSRRGASRGGVLLMVVTLYMSTHPCLLHHLAGLHLECVWDSYCAGLGHPGSAVWFDGEKLEAPLHTRRHELGTPYIART
jgi:hypothetical protein